MVTGQLIGGLGNQLFISATVLAYSLKHNMDYCIPRKVHQPHYPTTKDHSYNFQNIKYCDAELNLPIYTEPHYHYSEIPYMPNVCLNGYFQSWRYFHEYREEILKAFDIPYMREGPNSCSIHVRRGDYLLYPNHHPVISNEYLDEAQIYMMNKGVKYFLVFSDDIEWCKISIPQFNDCDYYFMEGNTGIEDLQLASECENSIGSNSSFSWWIYYLNKNKNKIGIFPSKWFGPELPNSISDLLPPECVVL